MWTSWGYRETPDVIAAVEFLEAHPTYGDADIGILGICMGSAGDKDLVWLDIAKGRAAAYDHLGEHPAEMLDWFTGRL